MSAPVKSAGVTKANPDPLAILVKPFCKYRTLQRQQIDRLDEFTSWDLERSQDGPSILSGDVNFESSGNAYSDDDADGSEKPEGQRDWNEFVAKVVRPDGLLPSFRPSSPSFFGQGSVAFASAGSAMLVRPGDDYGAAHRAAIDYDSGCTSGYLVTLADFPHKGEKNEADKQKPGPWLTVTRAGKYTFVAEGVSRSRRFARASFSR